MAPNLDDLNSFFLSFRFLIHSLMGIQFFVIKIYSKQQHDVERGVGVVRTESIMASRQAGRKNENIFFAFEIIFFINLQIHREPYLGIQEVYDEDGELGQDGSARLGFLMSTIDSTRVESG